MPRILIGLLLVAHGLLHGWLSTAPSPEPGGPNTPFWPGWWRADSNSAWLVTSLGLDNAAIRAFGGLLTMIVTAGFVLAGLGLLGVPGLHAIWRPLAIGSALAAMPLFVLFWHPWLVVGAALNVAILVSLLWVRWLPEDASA